MDWKNVGLSGASVSTCRGTNRVLAQLTANAKNAYDYLILHGGVNDAMDSAEIGTITDSYKVTDFDSSTFAGALEELFYYASRNYEGSRIGYIVNYATPNSTWGGRTKDMSEYFAVAKEICDKWGIPYLDLYSGTVMSEDEELSFSYDILEVDTAVCMYGNDLGEVHIGGEGYDRISPYIAAWMETLPVTESKAEVEESVLNGKSILFTGDSITYAGTDEKGRNGWAGRIGEDNDMEWKNAGVSGASISIVRPANRVLSQLIKNKETSYDYVILHVGVNDAWDSAEVGTVSDSFDLADFDVTTYAGGLEELFHFVCTHYQGARIGYIVNYATPNSICGGRTRDMSEYFEIGKQICDKWGIPYIDLYSGTVTVNGEELSYTYDILELDTAVCLHQQIAGEVHIGGVGYDRIAPYIAEWIKTLEVTETATDSSNRIAFYTGTGLTVTDGVLNGVVRRNTVADLKELMSENNGELVFTDAKGNVLEDSDKVTEGTKIQLFADGTAVDEVVVGTVAGADVSGYPENAGNLALDKKTWATSEYNTAGSGGGTAENATDGVTSNYWDGGTVKNVPTLTVDLGKAYQVGRINVVNYVTGSRYYQYKLFTSLDGEEWTLAAEKVDNQPATADGEDFIFEDKIEARYVRIIGMYNSDNEAFHVKELRVYESNKPLGADENVIPLSEMTATAGDAQNGEGAERAIDNNTGTLWHTNWNVGENHDNHWLQLNLNDVYTVEGFKYQPRQSGTNGLITEYEIWTSLDGENWETSAAGTWPADAAWKKVVFEEPVEAKYVRLVTIAAMDAGSTKFASAAEVRVLGTLYEEPVEEVYAEILTQPADVAVKAGENAVVTFEAAGDGLTYTWYYKNPGNSKFYVSGDSFVDENTYTIPMAAWRAGQEVYCVITDIYGNSATTEIVTLSMKQSDITIVTQPADAVAEHSGDTVTVFVEATGEGLTYTWYYKNPGNVKFYQSGSTFTDGNTYSIPLNKWRDGQQVYCVITDANGESVRTNTVTLHLAK